MKRLLAAALVLCSSAQAQTYVVPTHAVLMWVGNKDSVPGDYHVCDGTGGTPNLYNVFVKGVSGSSSAPLGTGGSATATYTPAGTVAAPTFTGTSNQATSATSGGTPAGTNGAPTLTMNAYTPAGSVAAPTFTGSAIATVTASKAGTSSGAFSTIGGAAPGSSFTPAGTNSAPAFTGTLATLTGSVAAPVFTGSVLATHTHTLTPTGTNSAPAFSGTQASIATEPSYVTVLFICKT